MASSARQGRGHSGARHAQHRHLPPQRPPAARGGPRALPPGGGARSGPRRSRLAVHRPRSPPA